MDSVILTEAYAEQIRTWLGERCAFTLLYRNTKDGGNAASFHARCDGRPKTVTVVKSSAGNVFGGYTSIAWKSSGEYIVDPNAFLFILSTNGNVSAPEKLPQLAGSTQSIYCNASCNPSFGGGHDLSSSAYSKAGHSYTRPISGAFAMGNGVQNFVTTEYEVFDVSQEMPLMVHPTSNIEWSEANLKKLKTYIGSYAPKYGMQLNVHVANLMVLGGAGTGKTSLLSSLKSAVEGDIVSVGVQGAGAAALTRKVTRISMEGAPGVRLWDTPGWLVNTFLAGELNYLLDGNVPNGYHLDVPLSASSPGFVVAPTFDQKMHGVLLLFPADMVSDEIYLNRTRSFLTFVRNRDINPVIGLTKVDLIDTKVLENALNDGSGLENLYLSEAVRKTINDISQKIGVPKNFIVPLRSYCKDYELHETNMYVDTVVLMCLKRALQCADDFFRKEHDKLD